MTDDEDKWHRDTLLVALIGRKSSMTAKGTER